MMQTWRPRLIVALLLSLTALLLSIGRAPSFWNTTALVLGAVGTLSGATLLIISRKW